MENLKKLQEFLFIVKSPTCFHLRLLFLSCLLVGSLAFYVTTGSPLFLSSAQFPPNPREGWAVILEMNDYPGSGSDLPTGFSDSQKWNATLHALGWQTHHIRFYQGELNQTVGETALQFCMYNADANDVVLFYIFAHGNWILNEMNWLGWFPDQWGSLVSQEKLLVVSACGSEAMIFEEDGISLASSRIEEYSWAGLPSEGLPIIGDVFNHFLTNAFTNSSADLDGNANITVEEAFDFASPLSRDYISSVVFPAFPYYADMSNNTAPHPVKLDNIPEQLSLIVEPGDPPINPAIWLPLEWGLIITIFGGIFFLLGFLIIRRRRYLD